MSINSPKPKYGQNFDKENQNSTKHFQSSFISTSRDQNSIYSSSKTSKKPQKISISSLIKRKSELYLDADLENTFDDLLEKGYNMVITRKNEKEELKQTNNLLQSEIESLEREILPLKNLLNTNKETQKNQKEILEKYDKERNELEELINKLGIEINNKSDDIQKEYEEINEKMKSLEVENNDLRSQISINKVSHAKERNDLERKSKCLKDKFNVLGQEVNDSKIKLDEKKMKQAERLRKMENKAKMYMGILKH